MIIGIAASGPRVGKTTTRRLLQELRPGLVSVNFADALKDDVLLMLRRHVGLDHSRDTLELLKGDVFGPLCQGLGEHHRRFVRESYWVDRWADRIRDHVGADVIADDVRHLNEAREIQDRGGFLLFVSGPQQVADDRSLAHASERHNSELMKLADYIILNEGSLEDLRGEVLMALESIVETERFGGHVRRKSA